MPTLMPDIANHTTAQTQGELDWVGMGNIEVPIMVASKDQPQRPVSAHVEAFVNLKDPKAKGIHMSRLYLLLDQLSNEGTLTVASITELLSGFVISHKDLSDKARVKFEFDYHMRRKSLVSGKQGWKAYPVHILGTLVDDIVSIELKVDIPYSSTCPCSAALARQLVQQAFNDEFGGKNLEHAEIYEWLGTTHGIIATPHSQRSIAEVRVKLSPEHADLPIKDLVDLVEDALQTPVQAAVKREDEQEFARLNGQNLMFCEDAARRLQFAIDQASNYQDYWIKVSHLESLHAHDAVSITTKGIENGFNA